MENNDKSSFVSKYLQGVKNRQSDISSQFDNTRTTVELANKDSSVVFIRVKNNSDKEIHDVRICFPIDANCRKENNYGNDESIECLSSLDSSTYEEQVNKIHNAEPTFSVGATCIQAIKVISQCHQFMEYVVEDSSKVIQRTKIIFLKDPYRNQTDNMTSYADCCNMNGGGIVILKVLPNAEFYLTIYRNLNINPASVLRNPNLIRTLPESTNKQNEG